tara:strand:- start:335 stop:937 length:603 start_codon:yes stop_codon:yes gene_type:complete
MASTAAPYGLKPVNLIGGQPYAGATRQIKIASGYNTNIFNGSVVSIVTAGTLEIVTTVGSNSSVFPAGTVGVFVGCSYTDPNSKQKVFAQYFPADTVASDAVGYVVDDPDVVFQIQADASVAQAGLGANAPLAAVQSTSTGSTVTGNSTSALDATVATTTQAFRIVDFVDSPNSSVGDAFTDVLVKFNIAQHSYTNATGI